MSDAYERCFYCGALLEKGNIELDHFPIPERNGGTNTVPSCRTCHGMKDRFNLGSWDVEWMSAVAMDFPNMSRETRIFLAKAASLFSDAIKRHNG